MDMFKKTISYKKNELKNIDQSGLETSMKIPYDLEYLLPNATKMKHQIKFLK